MASVNKVILVGNLGRDPEIRRTTSNMTVATLSVATTFSFKDRNTGERRDETEWHRVVFFNRLAEVAEQFLRKGSAVYVEGRLRTSKYTGSDGIERYSTEVVGEVMQMLGGRPNSSDSRVNDYPEHLAPDYNRSDSGFNQSTGFSSASSRPPADSGFSTAQSTPAPRANTMNQPRPDAPMTSNAMTSFEDDDIPF